MGGFQRKNDGCEQEASDGAENQKIRELSYILLDGNLVPIDPGAVPLFYVRPPFQGRLWFSIAEHIIQPDRRPPDGGEISNGPIDGPVKRSERLIPGTDLYTSPAA